MTSCPVCGEHNPPAARFCGRCGERVAPATAAATAAATPTSEPVPQSTGNARAGSAIEPGPQPTAGPVSQAARSVVPPPRLVRGRLVARAVALLLLVVLVVVVARSVLPGDAARTLALPPPGEVVAAFVEGEPVFVVHDDDGDVRVLDAVDAHVPGDAKVLAYCADSGTFENLRHGSRFTRRGDWVGGPAPTGMAAYEIVERDAERVAIGERGAPPAREDAELDGIVIGPSCIGRLVGVIGDPDSSAVDDLVMHDGPVSEDDVRWYPVSGLDKLLEEFAWSGDPDAS